MTSALREDWKLLHVLTGRIGEVLDGGVGDDGHLGLVAVVLFEPLQDFRPGSGPVDEIIGSHPVTTDAIGVGCQDR